VTPKGQDEKVRRISDELCYRVVADKHMHTHTHKSEWSGWSRPATGLCARDWTRDGGRSQHAKADGRLREPAA